MRRDERTTKQYRYGWASVPTVLQRKRTIECYFESPYSTPPELCPDVEKHVDTVRAMVINLADTHVALG